MTRPAPRMTSLTAAVVLLVTVVSSVGGMILRGLQEGPVWPAMLTDWSLGAALLALSSVGVGTVLVIRVRHNVVGWLFLAQGALSALVHVLRQATTLALVTEPASALPQWTAWGFAWVIPVNMTVLSLLLLLFPFGTPPSRRWRPVVAGTAATGVAAAIASMFSPYLADQTPFARLANPVDVLGPVAGPLAVDVTSEGILIGLVAGTVAVVVRLRRSRGVERQQMKWFVSAAVLAVATLIAGFELEPLFVVATLVALPAIPLAAGVAVLRYRLYDIDRVINRTVVYGAATAVLGATYLAAVTGLRAATANLTGDSALSVAASTLAVAALFRPVRNRIQSAVDRRFNRARYDATAAVQSLRTRLRDEVDLDALKGELVEVVSATMQPARTTLWLREAGR